MFSTTGIHWLIGLGVVGWLWFATAQMRGRALTHAQRLCRDIDAQCLDETVVLVGLRPRKLFRAGQCMEFRYRFELTLTGNERCRGELLMAHGRLEWGRIDQPGGSTIVGAKGPTQLH